MDFPKFNFRLVLKPRWFLYVPLRILCILSLYIRSQYSLRVKTDEIRDQRTRERHVIKHEISKWPSRRIFFEIFLLKKKFFQNFQPWRMLKDTYPRRKGMKKDSRTSSGIVKTFFVQITFRNNNLKCLTRMFNEILWRFHLCDYNNGSKTKFYAWVQNYMTAKWLKFYMYYHITVQSLACNIC